ncbi:MAG TPA: DUF1206 domain-containing protein [Gemmatimonadales bacterium]|jgi:hypothetical protein
MTDAQLERVAGEAAPLIGSLTRFGFGTKGLVTVLVGVLALRYALGAGGNITGQEGAIESVLGQPFGRALLAVIAAGLAAYALWMFVAAVVDPERKGTGVAGVAERAGFFVTGIGYALLAFAALKLLLGRPGGDGTDVDDLAASVLTPYVGRFLVGLAGAIVMTAGLLQLRLGITGRFRESLRQNLSRLERIITGVSGSVGYVTLGCLSLIVGYSLVQVAVDYDPSQAGGWDEALWLLSGLGRGRWLLGVAAAGLSLYGLYFVLLVRYRRL